MSLLHHHNRSSSLPMLSQADLVNSDRGVSTSLQQILSLSKSTTSQSRLAQQTALRQLAQLHYLQQLELDMANQLRLQVQSLPQISEHDQAAANSPARGKEMRANLLAKLRAPPLVHAWEFWHDRQDRQKAAAATISNGDNALSQQKYEERLVPLTDVTDVRTFWEMFNNFDTSRLPLRDSIHLFHKEVKPVWEDPRNVKGGCWTFRVPKDKSREFWKEVCLMAIGEKLQEAVNTNRMTFRDDICGISLCVRFNSSLVQIWNRDGDHTEGIQKILDTVMASLAPDLQPKEGSFYYKKHSEHAGFAAHVGEAGQKQAGREATTST